MHAVVGLQVVVLPILRIRHPSILRRARLLHADLLVLLLHVLYLLLVGVDFEGGLQLQLGCGRGVGEVLGLVGDLNRRRLLDLVKVVVCRRHGRDSIEALLRVLLGGLPGVEVLVENDEVVTLLDIPLQPKVFRQKVDQLRTRPIVSKLAGRLATLFQHQVEEGFALAAALD